MANNIQASLSLWCMRERAHLHKCVQSGQILRGGISDSSFSLYQLGALYWPINISPRGVPQMANFRILVACRSLTLSLYNNSSSIFVSPPSRSRTHNFASSLWRRVCCPPLLIKCPFFVVQWVSLSLLMPPAAVFEFYPQLSSFISL